jgi:hypothetical protein
VLWILANCQRQPLSVDVWGDWLGIGGLTHSAAHIQNQSAGMSCFRPNTWLNEVWKAYHGVCALKPDERNADARGERTPGLTSPCGQYYIHTHPSIRLFVFICTPQCNATPLLWVNGLACGATRPIGDVCEIITQSWDGDWWSGNLYGTDQHQLMESNDTKSSIFHEHYLVFKVEQKNSQHNNFSSKKKLRWKVNIFLPLF